MRHPVQIMQEVIQQKGIGADQMLACLLTLLTESHGLNSIMGFRNNKADSTSNAYSEIQGRMHLVGRKDEIPRSVLDALDVMLQTQWALDMANSQSIREKHPQEADQHLQRAKANEAFRQIIRTIINESEHQGLQNAMNLEKMAKEEGWKLIGDEEQAEGDDSEEDEDKSN